MATAILLGFAAEFGTLFRALYRLQNIHVNKAGLNIGKLSPSDFVAPSI